MEPVMKKQILLSKRNINKPEFSDLYSVDSLIETVKTDLKNIPKPPKTKSVSFNIANDIVREINIVENLTSNQTSQMLSENSAEVILCDSGASAHAVPSPKFLDNPETKPDIDDPFYTASGQKLVTSHIGNIGKITEVSCLPGLNSSILSVGKLCDEFNCELIFNRREVTIRHHGGGDDVCVGRRASRNGLYYFRLN